MSIDNETLVQRVIRTTDATVTNLYTITIPENAVTRTDLMILAKSPLGTAASWNVQLCAKRIGPLPAVLVQGGNAVINALKDNGINWTVSVTTSGNDVVVQAKGANGAIVDWQYSGIQISFVPPLI